MIRSIGVAERWNFTDPPRIVVLAANTATVLFPDDTESRGEIAYRYVQNVGLNRLYVSFGIKGPVPAPGTPQTGICDNISEFHAYIEAGQQIDCGVNGRGIVTGFSVAGTSVSTTLVRRKSGQPH